MSINKQIIITTILLIFSVIFFAISEVDLTVQDYFYNYDTHKWILDWALQPYRFIFYDGAKKTLILVGLSFLVALVFFRKTKLVKEYKKGILLIVLSAIFVPSITGLIKDNTNMPCPKHEIRYGGSYPRTAVWESYPTEFKQPKTKCWPAGHASGGFALLSIFFLFKKRRNRFLALGISFSIAWSMGLYKMIIGDHFLSHTLITMLLAWLIILILHKMVNFKSNL